MIPTKRLPILAIVFIVITAAGALWPAEASAQRRIIVRRGSVRPVVIVRPRYAYPVFGFGYGLYHVQTRPRAGLIEFENGQVRLAAVAPALEPGRGMRVRLFTARF